MDLSQKDRVLHYITQVGRATIDEIAEGTQLPKRSLYEVLKRLQSDEMLEKHGNRQSAVYVRTSIQQIEQFNSLLTENDHPPFKSEQLELKEAETVDTKASQPQSDSDIAPIQQIQHVESLLNRQDIDRENISPPIQQTAGVGSPPEKVSNDEKSEQGDAHFFENGVPPTPRESVELEPEPMSDKGCGIQQQFNSNSTSPLKVVIMLIMLKFDFFSCLNILLEFNFICSNTLVLNCTDSQIA